MISQNLSSVFAFSAGSVCFAPRGLGCKIIIKKKLLFKNVNMITINHYGDKFFVFDAKGTPHLNSVYHSPLMSLTTKRCRAFEM